VALGLELACAAAAAFAWQRLAQRGSTRGPLPASFAAEIDPEQGRGSSPAAAEAPHIDQGIERLESALERHTALTREDGFSPIRPGPPMKLGSAGPCVRALRERLEQGGDLADGPGGDRFDPPLLAAVRRFQEQHGLEPDGIVGRATLAELNVSPGRRARQLAVNLERWRTIPALGERYILANIAGLELRVFEGGTPALEMRIIAGKSYTPTPVMSDEITYLVLNPTWTIPESIARTEILPRVQAKPRYLRQQGIRVFSDPGDDGRAIDPASIDWDAIDPGALRYTFRQDAGPQNPLGRIKFMFPNRFNVYLHDTPGDHLFDRADRSLSHGCVRVEKPLELAALLLRGTDWTVDRLAEAIASGATRSIELPAPWPVHLVYLTAWVDDAGTVQFRKDVYGLDARGEVEGSASSVRSGKP
jgi:murein L,D-transpeptidase YcbB/YkuD